MAEYGYVMLSKKGRPESGRGAENSQIGDNVNTTNRKFQKISLKFRFGFKHQNPEGHSGIETCKLSTAAQHGMDSR